MAEPCPEGPPPGAHHVLQLRGQLWAAGMGRQGDRADHQVRGKPGAPGQSGPQLRQGPGHHQPGGGPRADPAPDEAGGRAGRGPLGAHHLGPGPGRDRHPHRERLPGGTPPRGHVPRGSDGRRHLHGAGAPLLGHRRPQQPHQHLLQRRPCGLRIVDGLRPSLGRLRQRQGHLPHLGAPGGRPLLQPARPADHRGPAERRDGHLHRSQAVQHGIQGRPLVLRLAGHRGVPAAGHRPVADPGRHLGRGVLRALGELGDVPARIATGPGAGVRQRGPCAAGALRRVHAGSRRPGLRNRRGPPTHRRPHHRRRPGRVRLPHLEGFVGGQRGRLDGGPLPAVPDGADRVRGHRGWHQRQRLEQVHARHPDTSRAPGPVERDAVADRVPAQPPRDVVPATALPEGRTGLPGHLLHPGLQPALDEPGRLHVDGGAARHRQDRMPCGAHPHLERVGVVRRLRAADGNRIGAPRRRQLRDPQRPLDRLSPARRPTTPGAGRRDHPAHLRGQPGRGLGGAGVLHRPVVADRPRRFVGHPLPVRERPESGHAAHARRVLLDAVRGFGSRPARGGRGSRHHPVGVHAPEGLVLTAR